MHKRIIIEIDGQRLEITGDQIDDLQLATPGTLVEGPCPCPKADCGYVHQSLEAPWYVQLSARLTSPAQWKPVS